MPLLWLLIRELQDVTISLLSRVRQFTPLQGGPAFYFPLFSQVPRRGIIRSSSEKIATRPAVNTPHGRCAGSRCLVGYCAVLAGAALESAVLPLRRRGFNSHRPL